MSTLEDVRARVDALLERTKERCPRPRKVGLVRQKGYRPWRGQRLFHRSAKRIRLLVAGRQTGKSVAAAWETVRIVMASPPGSSGAVLAPTYKIARAAINRLLAVAEHVPGAQWRESRKVLELPGGRSVEVFSADRKNDTVRGPTLVVLWIDEGAFLSADARNAALGALMAVRGAKILITTTPAGRNWVFDWWELAAKPEGQASYDRVRFKTTESPFRDDELLEQMRTAMSPEMFQQEFEAEFVDSLHLAFPDTSRLMVDDHPMGFRKGVSYWLGVDLASSTTDKSDWTVFTVTNSLGETWVLERFRESDFNVIEKRILEALESVQALARAESERAGVRGVGSVSLVIDTGGPGGGNGGPIAHHLARAGWNVIEVKTHVQNEKAAIVEQLRHDVRFGLVTMKRGEHTDQVLYEMKKFAGVKKVMHGREFTTWEGPQNKLNEFDDCVISFALANWGRASGGEEKKEAPRDLSAFKPAGGGGAVRFPVGRGGGYIFQRRQHDDGSTTDRPEPVRALARSVDRCWARGSHLAA